MSVEGTQVVKLVSGFYFERVPCSSDYLCPQDLTGKVSFPTDVETLSYNFRCWTLIVLNALQFMMYVSRPMANVLSDLEFSSPPAPA